MNQPSLLFEEFLLFDRGHECMAGNRLGIDYLGGNQSMWSLGDEKDLMAHNQSFI